MLDKVLLQILPSTVVNKKVRGWVLVQCPDCLKERIIRRDSYNIAKTTLCRSCDNLRRPTKDKNDLFNATAYYRSKKGRIAYMYQSHVKRSHLYGWKLPEYTREELISWCMVQPQYSAIYDAWVNSGFIKNKSPSIDRLDDYYHYAFHNIRLTTWEENNKKGREDKKSGKNTKLSIAVDQLTLDGEFIQRFPSMHIAERSTQVDSWSISRLCKNPKMKSKSYLWRYSTIPNDNSMKSLD